MKQTIVDLLRERAASRADVEAYRFLRDGEGNPEIRTWADTDRRARAIGKTLRERGAAGTNVLMLYPPGMDFVDGYFGCLYAGAVPVPAYPPDPARLQRTLPRVQAIVADAGAKFALSTKPLLALAEMVFAFAPDLKALSWLATDTIDLAAADAWTRPDVTDESLAMLQYTSGSTGTPKGVMLSHGNMLSNASSVLSAFEITPEDRFFSWLPVFHDMGFMLGVLHPLYAGVSVTAMSPTAFLERPYRWLAGISNSKATLSGSPNFGFDLAVRKTTEEQRSALDLSRWKLAFNGAESVRLDTIERFAEAFAPVGLRRATMFPCYGLAEATLIVSGSSRAAEPISHSFDKAALEEGIVRPHANGQVLVASGGIVAHTTVAIVDPETATRAAPDRIGEIWIQGGSVGRGYWNRAEETAATFDVKLVGEDGRYMRSGDLGFMYEGQLYVCGRVKDLIIIRGSNHYPQDIELTVERASAAIRPGCVAAFALASDQGERVVVVAEIDRRHEKDRRTARRGDGPDRRSGEPSRPDVEPLDVDRLFWDVREAIAANHELDPYAIVLVKAGSIHKTSSGKLQRRACRASFIKGDLEMLAEWRSDGTKRHSDVPSKPRAKTPSSQPVSAAKPAPVKLAIDLAALRRPSVIVVARAAELAANLADPRYTVGEGDVARALAGGHAVVVADELSVLEQVAAKHAATARIYVSAFDDPEAVRRALATGVIVVPATSGRDQLVAAVREQVAAWVAQETDVATSAIEDWLAAWLAERLDLNRKAIDLDAPVGGYGLDSLMIVEVQTAFSDWLGHDVPATLLRGRSSIRSIARRLTSADVMARSPRSRLGEDVGIAIVGMGCTTPGARDVGELWDLIANDRDVVHQVSEDRIRNAPAQRWAGTIDHIAAFDATFFGLAPRDAATIDPQHRVLLETTWRAFEDAGISPAELSGSNAAVFVGISGSDFLRARPELSLSDRTAAAAQRLSYFLNLRGPSFAVDAGDASSLVALQLAVGSLQRGECDLAIAAGVNLTLTPDFPGAYARAKLISSDGKCRPLDAKADGTALSDGCGVVILRRLADARETGNRIHAQLLAIATGQNGRGHGLTAPNEAAQERVLREAVQAANIAASDIGYLELNGRGVPAFDAIEARAVAGVLGADRAPDRKLVVGSLKANLGDTRAASGMLGVIKAALALGHDEIPRLLHLRDLAPGIAAYEGLHVPTAPVPWPAGDKRIACVDCFGLLGMNAVAILARETPPTPPPANPLPSELCCLSARSEDALRALANAYASLDGKALADVCYTANSGRSHFTQRVALVAPTLGSLREQLGKVARGEIEPKRALGRGAARIAFLFTATAMGAGAARQLYELEPRFAAALDRCDRVVSEVLGTSLVGGLYANGWRAELEVTAAVAIQIALAELWQIWGIHPDFVLGHGAGEYAAAAVVGALSVERAIALACGRDKIQPARPPAVPMISSATGTRVTELGTDHWAQLGSANQLERGIKELVRLGIDVFLELGAPMVARQQPPPGPGVWLSSLDNTADWDRMIGSLGALYERGLVPSWRGVYAGQSRSRVTLPGYPFERRPCWPEDT